MARPKLYIITGLSGAGKSQAMHHFEDFGFYCVDNLPAKLLLTFAELCQQSKGNMSKVVLLLDVRSDDFPDTFLASLDELDARGYDWEMLYFEASEEELLNRFKETRRKHPLMEKYGSVRACIEAERELMEPVRLRANRIVNTTGLSAKQLKHQLAAKYAQQGGRMQLQLTVISFGFKHGLPQSAELVFDVRPLPNPYYEPALKHLTGLDAEVREFLFSDPRTHQLMERIKALVKFMLPLYEEEGRMAVALALGCTGGRHRSVVLASELSDWLSALGYTVTVEHRDLRAAKTEATDLVE
jgi:UPF0042 nucleotide-binding protein